MPTDNQVTDLLNSLMEMLKPMVSIPQPPINNQNKPNDGKTK